MFSCLSTLLPRPALLSFKWIAFKYLRPTTSSNWGSKNQLKQRAACPCNEGVHLRHCGVVGLLCADVVACCKHVAGVKAHPNAICFVEPSALQSHSTV